MLNTNLSQTHHTIKELELSKQKLKDLLEKSLKEIEKSAKYAKKLNLKVAAGHGLNYQNTKLILTIKEIEELNIGQSIIARSVFTGLSQAIIDMKELLKNA